jgi:uncharacterized protein YcfJ
MIDEDEPQRQPATGIEPYRHRRCRDLVMGEGTLCPEPITENRIVAATVFSWRTAMKAPIVCTAILGIAFVPSAAEAKGCIKGAIVGGLAGHLAGHGKVGAVAGCVIGHHEANKRDANRTDRKTPPSSQDPRI